MTAFDWGPLGLSLALAGVTTATLLIVATPLAWWLARSRSSLTPFVHAFVALPLVLPPTVLGFYLLLALNPEAPLGAAWVGLTGEALTFSFSGLVVASVVYSAPFAVQPIHNAFRALGRGPMELASGLGLPPGAAFRVVALPLALRGYVTAGVLTFAHTLGEFGVVLMIGGSIPGRTRVVSVQIYEQVETLRYQEAHALSALLLTLSFAVLCAVYLWNGGRDARVG